MSEAVTVSPTSTDGGDVKNASPASSSASPSSSFCSSCCRRPLSCCSAVRGWRIGRSSNFCGCLSLQAGFVFITTFALSWGIILTCVCFPLWHLLAASQWFVVSVQKVLSADQWTTFATAVSSYSASRDKALSDRDPQAVAASMEQLTRDLRTWLWWAVWVGGILWTCCGVLGLWGTCGCLLGRHKDTRSRRRSIFVLASIMFMVAACLLVVGLVIGFPFWLKNQRNIVALNTAGRIAVYVVAFGLPPVIGGAWLVESSASYYRVTKRGGLGTELQSADQLDKQAEAEKKSYVIMALEEGRSERGEVGNSEEKKPLLATGEAA